MEVGGALVDVAGVLNDLAIAFSGVSTCIWLYTARSISINLRLAIIARSRLACVTCVSYPYYFY